MFSVKLVFVADTKVFEEALDAFLGSLKIFGPAQNIFEAAKGKGIRLILMTMCFYEKMN